MSLKLRLNLLITLLLALVMLAGMLYILRSAREDVRAEVQSSAHLALYFLDSELRRAVASGVPNFPPFGLESLGGVRHVRIEFRDGSGRVLESNRGPQGDGAGSAPRWFAWLVAWGNPLWEDIRRPVTAQGKVIGELVVRPDPSFEVEEIWSDTRNLIELSALLFLALNALVYWVVGRALSPVGRILSALTELERGNLSTRLPEIELPELARIGREFNRMMDTLQASVTRNRRLAQQLLRLQEEERRALAHELHDELGQYLTAIHADATTIVNLTREGPAPIRDGAAAIVGSVREVMRMVRGMLQRLHPETLENLGLEEALRELVNGWRMRNAGIGCGLEFDTPLGELDSATGIAVYRVVQEALTNVTRHAQASRVEVKLCRNDSATSEELRVTVSDDGVGMPEGTQRGFGLLGMRERVEALGGSLALASGEPRGVTLSLRLPLAAATGTTTNGTR